MIDKPRKERVKISCDEALCYQVSAIVAVDARGQTVLPKEVRGKMGITAGDKLALIVHESGGKACCMSLVKINELSQMVRRPLRAILREGDA